MAHRSQLEWVMTTYAVTFGRRPRLIWTAARDLEELRPMADAEEHRVRSLVGTTARGAAVRQIAEHYLGTVNGFVV